MVEEARSRALIARWDEACARIVMHPGGHFLPSQRPWLDAAVGFVLDVVGRKLGARGQGHVQNGIRQEQSVEDMNVPF